MAGSPEALVQLARLIGLALPRDQSAAALKEAVEANFDRLAAGLLTETATSDDVFDRESALSFLDSRLAFLSSVLDEAQRARLRRTLEEKIGRW